MDAGAGQRNPAALIPEPGWPDAPPEGEPSHRGRSKAGPWPAPVRPPVRYFEAGAPVVGTVLVARLHRPGGRGQPGRDRVLERRRIVGSRSHDSRRHNNSPTRKAASPLAIAFEILVDHRGWTRGIVPATLGP
jgi:hypothetical protein